MAMSSAYLSFGSLGGGRTAEHKSSTHVSLLLRQANGAIMVNTTLDSARVMSVLLFIARAAPQDPVQERTIVLSEGCAPKAVWLLVLVLYG